jgi:hypothetical protein
MKSNDKDFDGSIMDRRLVAQVLLPVSRDT